jgi:hypothetical protein
MSYEHEPDLRVTATVELRNDGQGGAHVSVKVESEGLQPLVAMIDDAEAEMTVAGRGLKDAVLRAVGAQQDSPSVDMKAARRNRRAGRA